jgi:drug/metabolite transporter (DMT)-like permease
MIPASKAMPFRYINVIIGFLIDVFYYALSFDWLSILGILITSLSLAYMTIQKVSKK